MTLKYRTGHVVSRKTGNVEDKIFIGFRGFELKNQYPDAMMDDLFLESDGSRVWSIWQIEDMKAFEEYWEEFYPTPPFLIPIKVMQ